ncbi:MAG: ligase-associated DNA damage response endonuclease PdeM [Bacteroidia bacterium]|nr:ligase-associated DNA damage response endonuclease PdeM [Bacteroidia bacterium]
MQAAEKFLLLGQTLWLSPERCIYWEEQQALIVSDLHFGKTGHFRKSGIPVPQNIYKDDLQRLISQVQHFKPQQLIVVGDLFHSVANKELDLFQRWRNDLSALHIQLVKGNHDILKNEWYSSVSIEVTNDHLSVANFCFVHDITQACEPSGEVNYYFSGHIHPCVSLNGPGRQSLKFPCFYFGKEYAILPAFGKFTGTALIERGYGDSVFAILPSNILKGEKGVVVKL